MKKTYRFHVDVELRGIVDIEATSEEQAMKHLVECDCYLNLPEGWDCNELNILSCEEVEQD